MARRKRYPKKTVEDFETKAKIVDGESNGKEEVKVVSRPKRIVRKRRAIKTSQSQVKCREVVYVGTADKSTVRGSVTGNKYSFLKDEYKMPKSVKVDAQDYPGIIALKGKGCARRDPNALFLSKQDWDLEIEEAKRSNS